MKIKEFSSPIFNIQYSTFNIFNWRFTFLFILFSSFFSATSGQQKVTPLQFNSEQAEHYHKNSNLKIASVTDTINFPFFDDFTTSSVVPDTSRWMPNGGTYVNNSFAINPPNFNVVSFDGISSNGSPYDIGNGGTNTGLTDNLTSKPINLSVLKNGNVIHLRFYWQGDGLGESPDPTKDSIRLQLKNRNGNWDKVWSETADNTPGFQLQQIAISDSVKYFYNGFQFRFQSFGRRSGSFDVWNIDYIMLDTGMLASDNWTPDYSFVTTPPSLLNNYTAMPFSQFRLSELRDTVKVVIKSLNNKDSGAKIVDRSGQVTNEKNGQILDTIPEKPPFFINAGSTYLYNWKIDKTVFSSLSSESIIKYKFTLDSVKGNPRKDSLYDYFSPFDQLGKSRIDFQVNDSISRLTYLTDYFAYDDGSAEFGYGVNQFMGKIAVKFQLNEPDTLTHINICFPKMLKNWNGEPIVLLVWSDIQPGTANSTILYNETVVLKHSTSINSFESYQLSTPLYITSSVFYVGYQQALNEYIFAGFDKNNDHRDKIFYSVNGLWFEENDDSGSVMIRPVFRSKTVTSTFKKSEALEAEVFPNPTSGECFISGEVTLVNIYDISGKLLSSESFPLHRNEIKSIDISFLPDGFYFVHLSNGERKTVKKIILNK
jgi:hypothetical protein